MNATAPASTRIKLAAIRAALARVRHAVAARPSKGTTPLYPLHGVQVEVGLIGVTIIATDGCRLAFAEINGGTTEKASRSVVDPGEFAKALHAAKGSDVDVRTTPGGLMIGDVKLAAVTSAKREELPAWRDVVPPPSSGVPCDVRDRVALVKILREHADAIAGREAEARERRRPGREVERAAIRDLLVRIREMRAAQKVAVGQVRAERAAAPKAARAELTVKLYKLRDAGARAMEPLREELKRLRESVKDHGGWEVRPGSTITLKAGRLTIETTDSGLARRLTEARGDAVPMSWLDAIVAHPDGEIVGARDVKDEFVVRANPRYLADALESSRADVEIRVLNAHSAIMLRGRAAKDLPLTCAVMPINMG